MSPDPAGIANADPPHERSDSRRKRLRLIEAARIVVADKGLEASAAEIAARAEVGVGTLYRRFGTKEALIEDIIRDGFQEVQAAADRALASADAWVGLAQFLSDFSATQTANRGIYEFTAGETWVTSPRMRAEIVKLRDAIKAITERAHRSGALRMDVTWRDIVVLSLASVNATQCLGVNATDSQTERTAAILLSGMRVAADAAPLPGRPPVDLLA